MNLKRAVDLVGLWKEEWSIYPADQSPMQQALICLADEVSATGLLAVHDRAEKAVAETADLKRRIKLAINDLTI